MMRFSNKLTISVNKMLADNKLTEVAGSYIHIIILLASLKYISLVTLTVQNAALILWLRYVRTREGDMFLSATAVVMAELIKCFISLSIILYQVRKK